MPTDLDSPPLNAQARALLRLGVIICLIAAATLGVAAGSAQAARVRTCFYYSNSGWGLWATRNVSCRRARHVYNLATRRCRASCHVSPWIDGFRCRLAFDGGGDGTCVASRGRRIRFSVP